MDMLSVILGNKDNGIIINYIFLITKHEIYKSEWNRNNINLIKMKKILKYHMNFDIYLGTVRNSLPKTLGKWSSIYYVLRTLP